MEIKIKKLEANAIIPKLATVGAACFDLHAWLSTSHALVNLGSSVVIKTGLSFEVPEGHVMLIFSRSGHGFKQNVRLANCVGVIDSDYRGEVCVKLTRDESDGPDMRVVHGDRIAQAMILPVPKVSFAQVSDLSETERGAGGFGSTGANAAPDADGWIEWKGGDTAPVPPGTQVEAKTREGELLQFTAKAGGMSSHIMWGHSNLPDDIVRYRVIRATSDTPVAP